MTTLPPLEPVQRVVGSLAAAGIRCALGASGLLHALGLAGTVRDWDVTTDHELGEVCAALGDVSVRHAGPDGIHRDDKLVVDGGVVEVIVRMAIAAESGVCRIPTIVTGTWRGLPLGSPEAWAVAYALMGRREKADLLFAHLRRTGADPDAVARIAAEPLPADVRARLVG